MPPTRHLCRPAAALTVPLACAQSHPPPGHAAWRVWNSICLVLFGVEFLVRILVYAEPWLDPTIWIDFLCIVPLAVRTTLSFTAQTTPVELYLSGKHLGVPMFLLSSLAALRMLKMIGNFLGTSVLKNTLRDSITALVIPTYLLVMLLTFFGSIIFAVEYEPTDVHNGARVSDVTDAWWMLLVTMTTVGYGDYSPQTTAGRFLTALAMIAGLAAIAMPLAVVGSNFQQAWDHRMVR